MAARKPSLSERFARLMRLRDPDDPLSSVQATTRWAEHLPLGDALKAQTEILVEVKRYNDEDAPRSKERLLILMLLDEKGQHTQAVLSRQYLRNPRMSRSVESQLWHAIYHLNWEILRAYHGYLIEYARNPGKSRIKAMVPMITLRALRGFRRAIKWRSIRYLHAGTKTWARLHQLYQLAETQGFHKTRLLAYPDDAQESTCEGEYLHTLMLEQSNIASLYPRQIDLIDTWLTGWRDLLELERTLDIERHVLAVDFTKDHGAKRVRDDDPDLSARYWSTQPLLDKLKTLQASLHAGIAPARLGLTEHVRVSESLELLEHLARQWAPLSAHEKRRAPRKPVKKIVEIVHGLAAALVQIRADAAGEGSGQPKERMDYDDHTSLGIYGFVTNRSLNRPPYASAQKPETSEIERWVVEDESEHGFGANIEALDKDWLRIGMLVGVRADKSAGWSLGVIRRLARQSDTESSVGIETLPGRPREILLYTRQAQAYTVDGMGHGKASNGIACLLFDEGRDPPSIVMDPLHYQRKSIVEYRQGEANLTIQLDDPIDHGEGWIRVGLTRLG
ncbi:MAG: hypothetical protein AB1591_01680 [Pseudomonadota bacterium]